MALPARLELPDVAARVQPSVPPGFTVQAILDGVTVPDASPAEQARGFLLFGRPIIRPIYDTTVPAAHERVERLAAFAAQGEIEPLTFGVHALRDLANLRVQASELRCGAQVIAPEQLDLRLVTSWPMRQPMYSSDGLCRFQPELLESVTVCSFPRGQSRRYWLTVQVPTHTPAGLYSGWITLHDDRSSQATRLPVVLRVMDFSLQRDPAKRYSVYYYDATYSFPGMTGALQRTAMMNDFAAMKRQGIDQFPTVPLRARQGTNGQIEVYFRHPEAIDAMIAAGFQAPIPIIGGVDLFYSRYVPGGKREAHWVVDRFPTNDAIYADIERAFRDFRLDAARRGWPEMICCPMDEVAPASAEFAARVFAAIRRSGMKTYITKDPLAMDAAVYRRLDAVDAWCSQPFSMPYDKVVADRRAVYWSYPNHNAGEIKDRVTMQKGGRMTYGFGLWRSGYTVLIPWHWRWTPCQEDPFDYLRGKQSGCGTRMDEQGHVIPAVYWECFREGYDDARYLFTLQQALHDRRATTDPRGRALLAEGHALLQEIWDAIEPREKYLAANIWDDAQFEVARWRLATMIEALQTLPVTSSGTAPSVMADTARVGSAKPDPFETAARLGILEQRDLGETGFARWKPQNSEVTMRTILTNELNPARPLLRMVVQVDHTVDGGGEKGQYPIGWPRLAREFASGEVDLTQYDYLTFNVNIDSDRDEVADDTTPFIVNFSSRAGVRKDMMLDLGDRQRTWIPVRIAVTDLLRESATDPAQWRQLRQIQLVIAESHYRHGTRLQFDIDRLELVKVAHPMIVRVDCADAILLPARYFAVAAEGLGLTEGGGYLLTATLRGPDGATLAETRDAVTSAARLLLALPATLAPGNCLLTLSVTDAAGRPVSTAERQVGVIPGFLPVP